ncbi:MAG: ribonuclease PH [Planctomycetales bacterium 4484_123]|nr:MAG: ribonuclease PH [Planctomycetales bacterium 4484_123]
MASFRRHDGRRANELRPVSFTLDYVPTAEGSCLVQMGGTRVICTACVLQGVPEWLEGAGRGWVTAEYGMLPASTAKRKRRPWGRPDGRSAEIQRLIGRVLRAVVAMDALGERTIYLDCDVLTADGGTRTAAINGAYVALAQAAASGALPRRAIARPVAAVSVGLVAGRAVLDLDYAEDSAAQVDLNVAMTAGGKYLEIQGTGEAAAFDDAQLQAMLRLARSGIRRIITAQRRVMRELKTSAPQGKPQ